MTVEHAPAVKIEFKIDTQCEIRLTLGEDRQPALTFTNPDFSIANLSELRKEVRDVLKKFNNTVGLQSILKPRQAVEALTQLHEGARQIVFKLFGPEARQLPAVTELCKNACPGWDQPGCDGDSAKRKLITVRAPIRYGIPIDILPLFIFSRLQLPTTLEGLASCFLGYGAIVKRDLAGIPASMHLENIPRPSSPENIPRLPLKLFINRSLSGALREEAYLSKSAHFDIERSWPDGRAPSNSAAFSQALAGYLWEPEQGFGGKSRNPPDQICHFSCHCDTLTTSLPKEYALWLQSGRLFGSGKQKVTLGALTDALLQLGMTNNTDRRPRPLIFFNACGSGDMDPAGAGSFPELFLRMALDFIGFIGTETTIPDDFASDFSEMFYQHLLAGIPIGRAIHDTRWKLLKSNNNPLGILYSLYAEPGIRLRSPVPELEEAMRRRAEPDQPTATTSGVWAFLRRGLVRRSGRKTAAR
jgi:hypothetical protein